MRVSLGMLSRAKNQKKRLQSKRPREAVLAGGHDSNSSIRSALTASHLGSTELCSFAQPCRILTSVYR
jgi:hypothetical protein